MKIKNIRQVRPRTVYAVQTSTNTFIADGLAHHNCVRCNHFNSGRLDVYAENLIKDYGLEWFNQLIRDAWSHTGYSIEEMMAKEQELKKELEKYE